MSFRSGDLAVLLHDCYEYGDDSKIAVARGQMVKVERRVTQAEMLVNHNLNYLGTGRVYRCRHPDHKRPLFVDEDFLCRADREWYERLRQDFEREMES